MPAALNGDYTSYPEAIKETLPYIAGETCELQQAWSVYHRLFMDDARLTAIISHRLGPLLRLFQTTLQDVMFLSIARLTDKDNPSQPNLSLWCLQEAVPFATTREFRVQVNDMLQTISRAADKVRKHRHKRIAHFDRNVSLKAAELPDVTLAEIRAVIELIDRFLNLFFWEFEQTTVRFDMLSAHDVTGVAEVTALKAHVYDILEKDGTIPASEWKRHWKV